MAHLITGYAGNEHIQSADQGSFNAAFFGTGQFVMDIGNKFAATIVSNNSVRVNDGDMLMYGRHIRINPNTYEDLTIQNGTSGKNRIDLIVMTYEKNTSSGVETAYLEVIKGTAVTGTAAEPSYTSGNILEGATKNQMPLYAVNIEGVVLKSVVAKFSICPTYKELAEKYEAEFIQACQTYLGALNIIDSGTEIMNNSTSNQLAGAVGVKELISVVQDALSAKAASNHTHDDRYFTETEITSKLAGKSNSGHTHDDRYYTESEVNTKFNEHITTWDYTKTDSYQIAANGTQEITFNAAWTGYDILGIVSIKAPYIVDIVSFHVEDTTAKIRVRNSTQGYVTVSNITIRVLYKKNM